MAERATSMVARRRAVHAAAHDGMTGASCAARAPGVYARHGRSSRDRARLWLVVALAVLGAAGCQRRAVPLYPVPDVPPADVPAREQPLRTAYEESSARLPLPVVQREMRGIWVATVANMDWPSRRSLSTAQAQQELIRILDTARDIGLNTVVLQVRAMGDAFYESSLEPWSDYLTGASGRAPQPYWDPLQFAIEQAHARGLELHAWFNPFRASFVSKQTPLAASHIMKRRPELVVRYGSFWWMDPGEPEVRRHSLEVIRDVVRRYDIDAVHLDDYFYPYQERDAQDRLIQFPDDASWRRYGERSGLSRADWRRSNVDSFVEQLYAAVRAEKPHVRVGISPFGIWRPGSPPSVRGLDSYAEIFADSRKWLRNGWVDYFAPQLYWRTHAPQQDYATLLQWWVEQNTHGRQIVAGNIPNSIGTGTRQWPASEIVEQVRLTRENAGATGNIHFSASSLLRNPLGIYDALRTQHYAAPALVPASPWLGAAPPARPHVDALADDGLVATRLRLTTPTPPATWIVHARTAGQWRTLLMPGSATEFHLGWIEGTAPDAIAVIAVDRVGVESGAAVVELR